jgi:hypothetical protein
MVDGSRGAGHKLRGGVAALFLDELYLIVDELLTHLLIVMMMVVIMMVVMIFIYMMIVVMR